MTNTIHHKKIAVILHLYYADLWDYFLPYLRNIDTDIDLYISITTGHCDSFTPEIEDSIKAEFPDTFITLLPNRGMDVAPFLYWMNEILKENRNYDCILKLHSKKSLAHSFELGERWRQQLTFALIGTTEKLTHNYYACINPDCKKVASSQWILPQRIIGYEQQFFQAEIDFEQYEFVGGTMFMINFELLKEWLIKDKIYERYYDKFEDGYIGDDSIAHQLERAFGCLMALNRLKILGA